MYSNKDAANPAYPTQWALNPTAYQNVDSSQVDWAALAQQWIAMKEAAAIVAAPPPPSMKPDIEEAGEAPMEVENTDNSDGPANSEWNSNSNSWGSNWNQWGWGWSSSGPVDPKQAPPPAMTLPPMMDGFNVPPDAAAPPMPGYSTSAVPAPTFQHGYWTAPQVDQPTSRSSSTSRDRRSKSKNRDHKVTRNSRSQRDKPTVMPPVIEPIIVPSAMPMPAIDAAKRRQLPAWIREGLEKMEREKQRAIEREQEMKAREVAEKEKKKLEEAELERLKAEASGQPVLPPKSKFESDSEGEDMTKDEKPSSPVKEDPPPEDEPEEPAPLIKKTKEEIMQEVMLAVRRSLTEILLEVTDQEIQTVSQEELARYTVVQASRLNAMKASKSKALASITSGLGLGAYESSSDDSADEDDHNDLSDQQLQDIIKRKRQEFERTAREMDVEERAPATPDRPRPPRSETPPVETDTPEKNPERRISRDKRNNHKSIDKVDGIKKLSTIPEEKSKKSIKRDRTPSPQLRSTPKINQEESPSSSSDSEDDSSSSSSESSSESEPEIKVEIAQSKKRKRKSSSSNESHRRSKREKLKKEKSHKPDERSSRSKSKNYEDVNKSRRKRKDDYERYKCKSGEERSEDKYGDRSEERARKRSKRSRSASYESRSGRRRTSRDKRDKRDKRDAGRRDRSHERDETRARRDERPHDKYDRYERSREGERRRERSASYTRHRR